jgi:hypothetical protein
MTTTYFATPADFKTWLEENHTNAEFLLVGFYMMFSFSCE